MPKPPSPFRTLSPGYNYVGARVFVDGQFEAIVKEAFPEGSTSYAFPHCKIDFIGGDRNVAVATSRLKLKLKGD